MNLISAQRIYYYIFDEIEKHENSSSKLFSVHQEDEQDKVIGGEDKTVPKVISKLMHRFRTKLLTNNSKKKKKPKKAEISTPQDPKNFRRSLSLKMGTDKINDNMIRMEVINKFK